MRHKVNGLWALLVVALCAAALVAVPRPADAFDPSGNFEPGYSYSSSSNGVDRSAWMRDLPGDLRLGDLTLPGTHDSGTWQVGGLEVAVKLPSEAEEWLDLFLGFNNTTIKAGIEAFSTTQLMSIETQLTVGVRALDIRLGHIDNPRCNDPDELRVVHGDLACYPDTFRDVMWDVTGFLNEFPSETVVMRVKRDAGGKAIEEVNEFDANVREVLTDPAHADRVFTPQTYPQRPECDPAATEPETGRPLLDLYDQNCLDMNPTLEEMRGKVVILQDWFPHRTKIGNDWVFDMPWFGIPYPERLDERADGSQYMGWDVQDDYKMEALEIGLKFYSAHRHFVRFNNLGSGGRSINFLSASDPPWGAPFQLAGGKSLLDPRTRAKQLITPWIPWTCDYPACLQEGHLDAASGGGFYEHASWMYFKGVNQLALEHIGYNREWNRLGIVYADFPGPGDAKSDDGWTNKGLIGLLIDVNFRHRPMGPTIEMQFGGVQLPNGAWLRPGTSTTVTYVIHNPNYNLLDHNASTVLEKVSFDPPNDPTGAVRATFESAETPGGGLFPAVPNCGSGTSGFYLDTANGNRPTIGRLPLHCRVTFRLEPVTQPGTYDLTTTVLGQTPGGQTVVGNTVSRTLHVGELQPQLLSFNASNYSWDPESGAFYLPPGAVPFGLSSPLGDQPYVPNNVVGGRLLNFAYGGSSGNPVQFSVDASTTNDACRLVAQGVRTATVVAFPPPAPEFPVQAYELSLDRPGRCVINANQAGSATHLAAEPIQQAFEVVESVPQRVTFTSTPPEPAVIGATYALTATGGWSNNPIVFSVDAERTVNQACALGADGTTVVLQRGGLCVVNARQAGNEFYSAADNTQAFEVVTSTSSVREQRVTWSTSGSQGLDPEVGSTITVQASGGTSGNDVTLSVDTGSLDGTCRILSQEPRPGSAVTVAQVRMEHAGHCIIDAFQEGDRDHRPGFGSTVILVVPARQSIEYTVVPTPAVAGTSVTLQAWGGGSGLPVQMSIDASTTNDACSLVYVVNTLVLNKAGTCVVNYDQAGNRDYRPAPRMQQSFEVLPRNEAPVAVASADPTSGVAPLQVSFDGSGSSDADGEIASFDWNFGDGSDPVSGAEVTHTYAEPGIYTATLTVVDDDGLSSTDTVEITVEEAPPLTDSLSVTIRGGSTTTCRRCRRRATS